MLIALEIKNFISIPTLKINFKPEFTVITGETGTGKSLLVEALALALGKKASSKLVRPGTTQAEIALTFELSQNPLAKRWLKEHRYPDTECFIQRFIYPDGKTRAYLNSQPISMTTLSAFSAHLIHLHRQHEHYGLFNPEEQRILLDAYANIIPLVQSVEMSYLNIQKAKKAVKTHIESFSSLETIPQLQYDLDELSALNPTPELIQDLEAKHQKLTHLATVVNHYQAALSCLDEQETSVLSQLTLTKKQLLEASRYALDALPIIQLLEQTEVLLQETIHTLTHQLDIDPDTQNELPHIEAQLQTLYHIARKHQVSLKDLPQYYQMLLQKKQELEQFNATLKTLEQAVTAAEMIYFEHAKKLSLQRQQAAITLENTVQHYLSWLELDSAEFSIRLSSEKPTAHGLERIHFWLRTHPGLPFNVLQTVASGGELSRVSLAISAASATALPVPTLIFDEVDSGMSGRTAETVGELLKQLAQNKQVLCITHLAPIASMGTHHLLVSKNNTETLPITQIKYLNETQRISEIARLMSGKRITPHTKAHAQELLKQRNYSAF